MALGVKDAQVRKDIVTAQEEVSTAFDALSDRNNPQEAQNILQTLLRDVLGKYGAPDYFEGTTDPGTGMPGEFIP